MPKPQLTGISMDAEARDEAVRAAHELARRDPEAGQLAMAQLQAVQGDMPVIAAYRPMRMYAWAALNFHWTDEAIERVDFRRFRGYLREAQALLREQQETTSGEYHEAAFVQSMQRPQVYEGSVVPIGR